MKIRTGCSGFYNRHWKGVFYPEGLAQSKWFAFYSEHFSTLELNSTFYKFPTVKSLVAWYKKSPQAFLFAVKAPRLITHYKKLIDCETEINEFHTACELGLKEKLGCVLFQFPPSFKYSPELLQLIVKSLKPSVKNVVEFRDVSWWNDAVFDTFKENNITFCSVSHPKLPEDIISTSATRYVRLHGNPQIFYSSYSDQYLANLYTLLEKNKNINEVFVFFNNTASTAGILNAQYFQSNFSQFIK